jgi:hypothetical protein
MSVARAEAKRHIYRCLSTMVRADLDGGAVYIHELVDDDEAESAYEGKKLRREVVEDLVQEISEELSKRAEPRKKL